MRIIERATNMTFNSPNDPLSSVDSLKRTKMTSALRREVRKQLSRNQLKSAVSLGDLLQELDKTPEEPCSLSAIDRLESEGKRGFRAWGMMWTSRCCWVLHRKQPLSEPVIRAALRKLIERHVALRTEFIDPYRFFGGTQKAFSVFEAFRRHVDPVDKDVKTRSALGRVAGDCIHGLCQATAWSFEHAWPRVTTSSPPGDQDVPLRVLERSETLELAEWRVWPRAQDFSPPFQAVLAPYGKNKDEGAVLFLAVCHMVSDGYSIIALLDDLSHFVAEEEAKEACRSMERALPPLPPLPNMFARMERRLVKTFWNSGGDTITREPIGGMRSHEAMCVYATIPPEVVSAVRGAARNLAVQDDIALLTILGVALSWFEDKKVEPIAMIVPQRDGPAENDMVGLFADFRHFNICTEGLSFAGVALSTHNTVQRRLWTEPGLCTQFDITIVNFEWTDFEERHGFVQRVTVGKRNESSPHPLRISVDQPNRDTWRMRVAFGRKQYNEAARERFFNLFENSLRALLHDPLRLVWPAVSPVTSDPNHRDVAA